MNDVHDCPFDIYTRDKVLAIVPDQGYYKGVITAAGDGVYDVKFDIGGHVEESVLGVLIKYQKGYAPRRKKGEAAPSQIIFKKGDRVMKQKDVKQVMIDSGRHTLVGCFWKMHIVCV